MSPSRPSLKLFFLIAPAGGLAGAATWCVAWKRGAGLIPSLILGGVVALGLPGLLSAWLWSKRRGGRPLPEDQKDGAGR